MTPSATPAGHARRAFFLIAACAALAPAAAWAHQGQASVGEQVLVSPGAGGGASNAPAAEPVISHDNRTARAVAYTSAATDIAGQQTGGFRNVYLALRGSSFGSDALEPWKLGSLSLASTAGPAPNGDSYAPALSGDDRHAAKCLAFVSAATNLVAGDGNGQPDVFVRPLGSATFTRVATRGAATDVSVDGKCKKIAFTTASGVFVKQLGGKTKKLASGNSSNVTISSKGSEVSFEKSGSVYLWRGNRVRRVSRGSNPSLSGSGKVIAFERSGSVYKLDLRGGGTRSLGAGSEPSLTLTGNFTFFARDRDIYEPALKRAVAGCPVRPSAPSASAHGNYVVYLCDRSNGATAGPQVFLSYVTSK